MITIATCFWDQNKFTYESSRGFSEMWVDKLYRGFRRHITGKFDFVCFSEKPRVYAEKAIRQERLTAKKPHCGSLCEPYRLGVPMIMVGLDTVITGNIDHMVQYCFTGNVIALPKHPRRDFACTGAAFVPAGFQSVWESYDPLQTDDMIHMRNQPHVYTGDLWPGQVLSYKHEVCAKQWGDGRIVYMHGRPKMDLLGHEPFVRNHWR